MRLHHLHVSFAPASPACYLLRRRMSSPGDLGHAISAADLRSTVCAEFSRLYRGLGRLDLLVRPRLALKLCDEVRSKVQDYDLPDDLILRMLSSR